MEFWESSSKLLPSFQGTQKVELKSKMYRIFRPDKRLELDSHRSCKWLNKIRKCDIFILGCEDYLIPANDSHWPFGQGCLQSWFFKCFKNFLLLKNWHTTPWWVSGHSMGNTALQNRELPWCKTLYRGIQSFKISSNLLLRDKKLILLKKYKG